MKIETDLGTADNIMLGKEPMQTVTCECYHCGFPNKVPLPVNLIDYREVYGETLVRLKEAYQYNGDLQKQVKELQNKLSSIGMIL